MQQASDVALKRVALGTRPGRRAFASVFVVALCLSASCDDGSNSSGVRPGALAVGAPQAVFVLDRSPMAYRLGKDGGFLDDLAEDSESTVRLRGVPSGRIELAVAGRSLVFASIEEKDGGKATAFRLYVIDRPGARLRVVQLASLPRPPEESDGVRIAGAGKGRAWVETPGALLDVDLTSLKVTQVPRPDEMFPCAVG